MKRCILLLSFVLFTAASATAATNTWDGSTGDWNDPAKWLPGGVPASTDTVIFNSGTINLSADVTHAGPMNWSRGTLNAGTNEFNIAATGLLTLSPGNYKYLRGKLRNAGTILLTDASTLFLQNTDAHLVNLSTGIFESEGGSRVDGAGSGPRWFDNQGTFRRLVEGTTTVDSKVTFTNTGTVDASMGTIDITTGTFSGSFTGAGSVRLLTGPFTFTGSVSSENVLLHSGQFFCDNAMLSGSWTWSLGRLCAGGSNDLATITAGSELTIIPGNYKYLDGPLDIAGTLRLTGNSTLFVVNSPTRLRTLPGGVVDSTGNDTFLRSGASGSVLENHGTWRKSGGTGNTRIDNLLVFTNAPVGVVEVLTNSLVIENAEISGQFKGPGETLLNNAANLHGDVSFENGRIASGGSSVYGDGATIHGDVTWTTGRIRTRIGAPGLTLANDCTLTLVPGNYKYFHGYLTNAGTIEFTGNTLLYFVNEPTRLVNLPGGLVDSTGNDTFDDSGGAGSVLENHGTWKKSGGSGNTTVTAGLVFTNTPVGVVEVLTNGLVIENAEISGQFKGPGETLLNNAANLHGDVSFDNGLITTSGNIYGDGATVHGHLTWSRGRLRTRVSEPGLTLANDCTLTLVPGNYKYFHGHLTNAGTIEFTGNTLLYLVNEPTRLVNLPGGLVDSTGNDTFDDSGGAGSVLENLGTWRKSGGTGNTTVTAGLVFTNTPVGVVEVLTNGLVIENAEISGQFKGPGETILNTHANLYGDVSFDNGLITTSGNVYGDGATVHGHITWSRGRLRTRVSEPGLTLADDCTLTLVPGNYKYFHGHITNAGTIELTGNTLLYLDNEPTRLVNLPGGLVDSTGNDTFSRAGTSGSVLENHGTWRKSGGTGNTIVNTGLVFENSGLLDARAGVMRFDVPPQLNSSGELKFLLNNLTNFARIDINAPAALAGAVGAELAPGFAPVEGDTFRVLDYSSYTGEFTRTELPPSYCWSQNYTNTWFELEIHHVFGAGPRVCFVDLDLVSPGTTVLTIQLEPDVPYTLLNSTNLTGTNIWTPIIQFTSPVSPFIYTNIGPARPAEFFIISSP